MAEKLAEEVENLAEEDWERLLRRIAGGKCTPFVGAGACGDLLPLAAQIAEEWAKKHRFPLEDTRDLARVAQFRAITGGDDMAIKEEIARSIADVEREDDFAAKFKANVALAVLAELPFPVYITTNYDNFLMKALEDQGKKPRLEICRWNELVRGDVDEFLEPTQDNPVVFHLHGHAGTADSLVLTEDDYLEFLVQISKNPKLLPPRIHGALTRASLLFLGYRMADWDFRVLFRALVGSLASNLQRAHIAVQVEPGEEARKYLVTYFGRLKVRVYWGDAHKFAGELRTRWKEFPK